MVDLHTKQLESELQQSDAGTKKALEKLEMSIKRDESSTGVGKKLLHGVYTSFRGTYGAYAQLQAVTSNKHTFFKNIISPSIAKYDETLGKYKSAKKFLSDPADLICFTVAREICKHIQQEAKLTTVAKCLLDTINQSYGIGLTIDEGNTIAAIAFVRMLVDGCDSLEIYHNRRSTVCIRLKDQAMMEHISGLSHIVAEVSYEPMVVEPTKHTSLYDISGGYILHRSPILKRKPKKFDYDCRVINDLQSTAYRIDSELLDLYGELGLLDIDAPGDFATEVKSKRATAQKLLWESKLESDDFTKQLKLLASTKISLELKEQISKNGVYTALLRTIGLLNKYRDFDRIYFPLFADTRGRLYTYCTDLSVQGNSLSRNVLKFADTCEVDDRGFEWLVTKLGALCGWDKYTNEVRYAEGSKLLPAIDAFFNDGDMGIFDACKEDIFEFVSVILEIYRCQWVEGYKSGFIYYIDSQNSGSQICSLLTKSKEGAKMTSLIDPDGDKLFDSYMDVADKLKGEYEVIAGMGDLSGLLDAYLEAEYRKMFDEKLKGV